MIMDRAEFWDVIESARKSALTTVDIPAWLKDNLEQKPVDYIIGFAQQLHNVDCEAYDARLWAAAFVMMEFCSDDKFMDFRSWLVAQGKSVFEAALNNPDTLAELKTLDGDFGQPILFRLRYIPAKAFRNRLNDEIADIPLNIGKPVLLNQNVWDGDRQKLPIMFPKLYAKYRDEA